MLELAINFDFLVTSSISHQSKLIVCAKCLPRNISVVNGTTPGDIIAINIYYSNGILRGVFIKVIGIDYKLLRDGKLL